MTELVAVELHGPDAAGLVALVWFMVLPTLWFIVLCVWRLMKWLYERTDRAFPGDRLSESVWGRRLGKALFPVWFVGIFVAPLGIGWLWTKSAALKSARLAGRRSKPKAAKLPTRASTPALRATTTATKTDPAVKLAKLGPARTPVEVPTESVGR